MLSELFSCKGACSGSDKVSDTVKVDAASLTRDKENVQPVQTSQKKLEAQKRREEVYNLAQEELRQKEAEAEQRRRAEKQRRAEEEAMRRRRKEEEAKALEALERRRELAEREAAEQAAAEAAAAAAEAAHREREEADRIAKENARQAREAVEKAAMLRAQQLEQQRQVDAWCKELGFADMHSKKSSFRGGTKYPLHKAVTTNNEEMVRLLVQFGADTHAKNSKGQTPMELATKINKGGSMDNILTMLA